MANVTIYWKDGTANVVSDFDLSYWKSQGWSTNKPSTTTNTTSNNQTTNNTQPTNQNNNGSVLFSAYGQTIYSNATKSQITAPDGSGRQAVKWTNPDGSYVWETVDGNNVKNYASQYYKAPTTNNDIFQTALNNKKQVDDGILTSTSVKVTDADKQAYIDAGFKIVGDQAVYIKNQTPTTPAVSSSYVYGNDKLNSKANNAAVNTLYQAYFGRNANQAELNNWGEQGGADTTVKALEDFLKGERTKYGVTTPIKTLAEITGNPIVPVTEEPITQTNTGSLDTMIPFRSGLTDAQKQSIITLSQKPVSQWSATDKSNWNWATSNAALPAETTTNTQTNEPETLIPFRDGLSAAQKASITSLSQKPYEQWNETDKLNWNWATNSAPMPGATPGTQNEIPEVDLSMYDSIINGDAFLTEQFKDAKIKENFSKMSPTLQMAYLQMLQSLGRTIEAGKVINPNIEITPEKIKEFTDQATSELDPYYQEQIKNYKTDLDTSISRLTEDFRTGVRNAEDPFKRNLEIQAESEAQAGLTYGSERIKRENTNVSEQQQKIDEIARTTGRSIEDAYKTTERALGSNAFGNVSIQGLPTYNVSNKGFSQTGTRNLFAPTGGVIGTLPKEETVAIKSRASELEEAFRNQRILNTNL